MAQINFTLRGLHGFLTAVLLSSSTAHASLIIDIAGVLGTNVTTWTFSGSAVATETDTLDTINFGQVWFDIGDYVVLGGPNLSSLAAITSTAVMTVGASSANITEVGIDNDTIGPFDDIGVGVANPLTSNPGDLISWTGVLTAGYEIGDLTPGTYGPAAADFFGSSDITVNVSRTPVPAPPALALIGIGMIFFRLRRSL